MQSVYSTAPTDFAKRNKETEEKRKLDYSKTFFPPNDHYKIVIANASFSQVFGVDLSKKGNLYRGFDKRLKIFHQKNEYMMLYINNQNG